MTAIERGTKGGRITITANLESGDIIMKQEAEIDFSGGGILYTQCSVPAIKLVSGNKSYDIGNAPQWIDYESVSQIVISKVMRHRKILAHRPEGIPVQF